MCRFLLLPALLTLAFSFTLTACGDDEAPAEDDPDACGQGEWASVCAEDEVCCNRSCGICAKPGEGCIALACN